MKWIFTGYSIVYFSNSKSVFLHLLNSNELEITELSSYVHSQESKVKSVAIFNEGSKSHKIFFFKLILGNLLTTSLKLVSENKVDLIDFQLSH
jgi:hypothetical protein